MLALLVTVSAMALERPAPIPEPLAKTPWELPGAEVRTLSNGLEVHVATNREVPLWEVRLVLAVGEHVDPKGQEGLIASTMDMMNEGAGDLDAAGLSRALHTLAGSVDTGSQSAMSTVSASGIKRNLEPVLDLWATVLLEPTFAAEDWDRVRKQRSQELVVSDQDPNDIARVAWARLVWGDDYLGRDPTPETLGAITVDDLKAAYGKYLGPENAVVVVAGDIDADEIVPLLEARIGTWKPQGVSRVDADASQLPIEAETIYFIDNPGASQSVVRSGHALPPRDDPGHYARIVANQQYGRAFTSRLNMNLREEKGYTYGARCLDLHWHGPGMFLCIAQVRADVTAASLIEFRDELKAVLGDEPLTDEEIAISRANLIQGYPGTFETTGPLLDEVVNMWLYDLPSDWITRYIAEIEKVDTKAANAAFRNAISPETTFWLVVGDKATTWDALAEIGLPIVELDREGRPIEP